MRFFGACEAMAGAVLKPIDFGLTPVMMTTSKAERASAVAHMPILERCHERTSQESTVSALDRSSQRLRCLGACRLAVEVWIRCHLARSRSRAVGLDGAQGGRSRYGLCLCLYVQCLPGWVPQVPSFLLLIPERRGTSTAEPRQEPGTGNWLRRTDYGPTTRRPRLPPFYSTTLYYGI